MSTVLIVVIVVVVIALLALAATQLRTRRRRAVAGRHHREADILEKRADEQRAEAERIREKAREVDPDGS